MKKGTKVVIGIIIAVPAIIVVTAVFIGRQYLRGARLGTPTAPPVADMHTNGFDFEKRTVLLNNRIEMPIYEIGAYNLTLEESEESVYWALESGAGLTDTASAYYKDVICCEL